MADTAAPSRLRPPTEDERRSACAAVAAALTPVPRLAAGLGPGRFLQLESLQPTGSFKVRGAVAALAALPAGAAAVSASAGNHALGMAWAAARLGVAVTVVTPETASPAKLAALETMAARPGSRLTISRHGSGYEEAEAHARDLAGTGAAVYVSAYSDWAVIAGQSTIGAELDEAFPPGEPLTVVAPLGGGGLASGLSLWAATRPATRVVAAEAAASPGAGASVRAGRVVAVAVGPTLADGLVGNLEEGCPTVEVLGAAVSEGRAAIVEITDDQLAAAMRWLFSAHGLVAEGAGAAGVAAVLAGLAGLAGGPGSVVAVVTGRNVTAAAFAAVLASGG